MLNAQPRVIVELFYDIISPYSWVTFEALCRYNKKFLTMDLKLQPVLLGAIMDKTLQKPPIPARKAYTANDLPRLCKYFNLPYKRPQNLHQLLFEKGTLRTQRMLTAVAKYHPHYLETLSSELYFRVWSEDLDAMSPDSLKEACTNVGLTNQSIDHLLCSTNDPVIKQTLKDTTQKALDYGAFGVPTYVVHLEENSEMLFGSDRLFLLAHYLNVPYPGPLNEMLSSN